MRSEELTTSEEEEDDGDRVRDVEEHDRARQDGVQRTRRSEVYSRVSFLVREGGEGRTDQSKGDDEGSSEVHCIVRDSRALHLGEEWREWKSWESQRQSLSVGDNGMGVLTSVSSKGVGHATTGGQDSLGCEGH